MYLKFIYINRPTYIIVFDEKYLRLIPPLIFYNNCKFIYPVTCFTVFIITPPT